MHASKFGYITVCVCVCALLLLARRMKNKLPVFKAFTPDRITVSVEEQYLHLCASSQSDDIHGASTRSPVCWCQA
jgi:hypothetical protein